MNKNLSIKKVIITLFVLFLCFSFYISNYKVYAATGFEKANLSSFDKDEVEIGDVKNTVDNVAATVITVVRIVAVTIAIVMLLAVSMRYMTAAPSDRADIKKHAVAYIVGAFVLFGVSGILTALLDVANQIKISS